MTGMISPSRQDETEPDTINAKAFKSSERVSRRQRERGEMVVLRLTAAGPLGEGLAPLNGQLERLIRVSMMRSRLGRLRVDRVAKEEGTNEARGRRALPGRD